jgi:hypothetical protein
MVPVQAQGAVMRRAQRFRRLLPALVIFGLVASSLTAVAEAASATSSRAQVISPSADLKIYFTGCPHLIVYGVRGSGEQTPFGLINPNGTRTLALLGSPVGNLAQDLVRSLSTAVGVAANGYPATGVDNLISAVQYYSSVKRGEQDTIADLKYLNSICPGSNIIVAGYSQGAHAVHLSLPALATALPSLISLGALTVVLFADPMFDDKDYENISVALGNQAPYALGPYDRRQTGLATHISLPGLPKKIAFPFGLSVLGYCHNQDIVCQNIGGTAQHVNYGLDSLGAAGAAYDLSQASYYAVPHTETGPTPGVLMGMWCPNHSRVLYWICLQRQSQWPELPSQWCRIHRWSPRSNKPPELPPVRQGGVDQ